MKSTSSLIVVLATIVARQGNAQPPEPTLETVTLADAKDAPTIRIVSPAPYSTIATTRKEVDTDSGSRQVQIPTDPKSVQIGLDVKGWDVAPNGRGIALVIDNAYAIVVHDLSKPITLDQVVRGEVEPGWHFLAAFATLPDGHAVRAPSALAVVRFMYGQAGAAFKVMDYDKNPLLVFNRPLLGSYVARDSAHSEAGWIVNRDAAPVEVLVYTPPGQAVRTDCVVPFNFDGHPWDQPRPAAPGSYIIHGLPAAHRRQPGKLLVGPLECPAHAQMPNAFGHDLVNWSSALLVYY